MAKASPHKWEFRARFRRHAGRAEENGDAAYLVLACAQVDSSSAGMKWLEGIRDDCRRYPALQRELGGGTGRA